MTIFARRRLQVMLDEVAPSLSGEKALDLVRRLNNSKLVDQALPAETELALLWSLRLLGPIEVEPDWWADRRRPDAVSDDLLPGRTAAIEIAATNDNSISGEEAMDAVALQIMAAASRIQKGAGDYLYFTFREESFYEQGRYVRRRLAPVPFVLSDEHRELISRWLKSPDREARPLLLQAEGLDVTIESKAYKQVRFHNIFSSMPPQTHSLDDNPLFDLLVRKAKQLRSAPDGTLRIIFLADVGSTLLRNIGRAFEMDHTGRNVSARDIILNFLRVRSRSVDAVVTFSPFKEVPRLFGIGLDERKPRRWTLGFFGTPALPSAPPALERIADQLPEPHYEGYQARSLFRQGAFSTQSTGQYLGMTIKSTAGQKKESVHFPARLLLDLLAGRITPERFRWALDGREGGRNLFKHWLDMGLTISGAEMAPRSTDEDDDHLILHFTDDAAARPFRLPDVDGEDGPAEGTGR